MWLVVAGSVIRGWQRWLAGWQVGSSLAVCWLVGSGPHALSTRAESDGKGREGIERIGQKVRANAGHDKPCRKETGGRDVGA